MSSIIDFFSALVDFALSPIFYLQERSSKKRVANFTRIFGFEPYGAAWNSNEIKVLKMLLQLGDKMPYERAAADRFKEAEKVARQCHFLTDPQYYNMFTDPESIAEFRRFLDELMRNSEEDEP